VAHYQLENIAWIRAQRHADAQLRRPLRDRVCDDTVDADHCQNQRGRRKQPEHNQRQARLGAGRADHLIHAPHVASAGQVERVAGEHGHSGEGTRLIAEQTVAQIGETLQLSASVGEQQRQPAWVGIRQRTQQQRVRNREDGRVGAYPERQCQDGYQRKAWALGQHSKRMAKINRHKSV